jgi:hypothetical protein
MACSRAHGPGINKKGMRTETILASFWLWALCVIISSGCAGVGAISDTGADTGPDRPEEIAIIEKFSGDFPVAALGLLPGGQSSSPAGFINDAAVFTGIWQAFKPGEAIPYVDFNLNVAVFCRNKVFYNRINIGKITLTRGEADIQAMETMSSMPIGDKMAMAIAVIPRTGVKCIRTGETCIPVPPAGKWDE